MRLFGYEIKVQNKVSLLEAENAQLRKQYSAYPAYGYPHQWNPVIAQEPFTGAWQRNMELRGQSVLGYPAVYACVTRISSDISKLPLLLVERDKNGIWSETESAAFSPVLREPNHYQSTNQFIEQWLFSKLITGNAYILKKKDNRGVVTELHVLDPRTTKPLVADSGEVYYEVSRDNLAGLLTDNNRVNASDIIHDRMNPMYHPLYGVTPLSAAGMAAIQGLAIQTQSTGFFQNQAAPSGMLSAPATIEKDTAERLKQHFESAFAGANAGRVVVGGDGLAWTPFTMTAVDAEVIKHLQMTATQVCACYQVPAFMVGFGETPKYDNIEAQIRLYFSQCLQSLTIGLEGLLDRGLGLNEPKDGVRYGTMFDLDVLFDMDTVNLINAMKEGVGGGILKPNEARKRLNYPPSEGGDQVFLQQQNYSLAALAKRDTRDDPFATGPKVGPGSSEFETLKATFDAYGVGVRAGAITPQVDDEKQFRAMAGFPQPSTAVTDVWTTEPIRRPITLKSVGDDPTLADASTVDDQEDEDQAEEESPDEEDVEADALRAAWMFERHMERLMA